MRFARKQRIAATRAFEAVSLEAASCGAKRRGSAIRLPTDMLGAELRNVFRHRRGEAKVSGPLPHSHRRVFFVLEGTVIGGNGNESADRSRHVRPPRRYHRPRTMNGMGVEWTIMTTAMFASRTKWNLVFNSELSAEINERFVTVPG